MRVNKKEEAVAWCRQIMPGARWEIGGPFRDAKPVSGGVPIQTVRGTGVYNGIYTVVDEADVEWILSQLNEAPNEASRCQVQVGVLRFCASDAEAVAAGLCGDSAARKLLMALAEHWRRMAEVTAEITTNADL
jgi:hypothetical protein